MRAVLLILALVLTACKEGVPEETSEIVRMNPDELSYNDYVHDELPEPLLLRIKATTDVFEPVDGISYEQAVDMYRRDPDPESNLVIWEEMARVFLVFCETRCDSPERKFEAYKALLLASMFPPDAVMEQLQPRALRSEDVKDIISMYGLPPEPIPVIRR
jgi:hypothetical protein